MNVITTSREYGVGGGEVARQPAEIRCWEWLDLALFHLAALIANLADAELKRLDEKGTDFGGTVSFSSDASEMHPRTDRGSPASCGSKQRAFRRTCYMIRGGQLTQHDSSAVGRCVCLACRTDGSIGKRVGGTGPGALPASQSHTGTFSVLLFFAAHACEPEQYKLIADTARFPFDEVVACVVTLVLEDRTTDARQGSVGPGVLTLARQLGAGDTGFAPTLADRLGLTVYDRALLRQAVIQLGIGESELENIDEQPASIFQRFRPGSPYQRYCEALKSPMHEQGRQGNGLIVGRSGSRLLREHPSALHGRLGAGMPVRIRLVMEHRWLREETARQFIAESDEQRRCFCRDYFGADRAEPLQYHLTLNTGRLGPTGADLIAFAAQRSWQQPGQRSAT